MAAHLVPRRRDPPDRVRVVVGPGADNEEGRLYAALVEQLQNFVDVAVVPRAVDSEGENLLGGLHRIDRSSRGAADTPITFPATPINISTTIRMTSSAKSVFLVNTPYMSHHLIVCLCAARRVHSKKGGAARGRAPFYYTIASALHEVASRLGGRHRAVPGRR